MSDREEHQGLSDGEQQQPSPPLSTPRKSSLSMSPIKLTKSIREVLEKPKDVFLRELYAFMEHIGQPITKMPSLGYQELDLKRLFTAVITRGGMDEVTRRQEWKLVYQDLDIPTMSTSASYNTRTNYKKYLYLFELDVCDWGEERPADAPGPRFKVGDYVRIESSTFEGQVFYAQISKYRYRNNTNSYYVHYNGWSTSHDEWMPEAVLDKLRPDEIANPADLPNPSPTRSSKSNYIIYDPMVSEKHHQQHQLKLASSSVTGGSAQTTPKQKRKKSSPGKGMSADEYDYDEEFIINSMANASRQQTQEHVRPSSNVASPAVGGRQSSRNKKGHAGGKDQGGRSGIFLEELDHPACDDKLQGYPRRRRDSEVILDFSLGHPEQVFYYGGQWKHSTPRVRKFFLHRTSLGQPLIASTIDEDLLKEIMATPKIVLPDLPRITKPKLPQPKAAVQIVSTDKRSASVIEAEIAEKESRLRDMKKDLKHKTKLLHKYYGRQSGKVSTASALLSASLKVSRR